jgi:hypothetical protein
MVDCKVKYNTEKGVLILIKNVHKRIFLSDCMYVMLLVMRNYFDGEDSWDDLGYVVGDQRKAERLLEDWSRRDFSKN